MAGPHAMVLAAADAAAARGATELSITTNPPDATVYVDGRFAGRTPMALASVAAGDHRIRVVKDGYLENARVVTVSAGRPQALDIKLTRSDGKSSADQVTSGGGGGGSKKWLWIGLAAAGGGTAAALALTGGNKAPSAGTASASPGTGLQAGTTISFTAQGASDPDGDGLTYQWDFGDGGSGTGATVTRVYNTSGNFSPVVTVSDGKKSATAGTSVTIRSMAGTWNGTVVGIPFTFTFTQTGSSLGGTYRDADGTGSITGTVQGNNSINVTVNQPGIQAFSFGGTVAGSLNTWSGTVLGFAFTATRQ